MEPKAPSPEHLARQLQSVQIPVVPVFEYQALHVPSRKEIEEAESSLDPDPRDALAGKLSQLSREGYADQVLALQDVILVGEQIGFWVAPMPTIQPGVAPTGGFIECRRKRPKP